ncbi:putative glycosyltransferase YkcC [Tenuifilaceae bacterium CYCD]|nr:putative glycosyltransferase YkcC [Tenuifilaceae bacterium CYCD]
MIELSVVVPLFNEGEIISELYFRLTNSVKNVTDDYELIFVNDGSSDATLFRIVELANSDNRVKYINFSRNFGHQIAVTAGLDHCKGNAVVIIDGDLQDPPELIPELYSRHRQGFEVVYAKRTKRKGETLFKRITAKLFYRLLKRLTSVSIPLDVGDFRLIDKKIVDYLRMMPEQNKFLRGQIAWLGFRSTFVEFERDGRKAGKTGYSLSKMKKFAIDGITAFSDKPLKLVTNIGFFIAGLAFLIILYALFSHFVLHETITGWTSLIVSSMFIGGIQLFSIGIIGEYISRINTNVLNRPLYIVEKTNIE